MHVAAIQMTCSPDRRDNLDRAERLIGAAADEGASLVVLPELFADLGPAAAMRRAAEPLDGPTVRWAARLAERHGVWLVAGSFVERAEDRLYNTSPLLGPTGELVASYRKVHLFDVDVDGAGMHESAVFAAGGSVVAAQVDELGMLGLTTCYDLRFPELFRLLALEGATCVVMPSAFTEATGRPHWEPLVRARAIENQLFVVAPDQCGSSADGIARHGNSLVVDPWGRVLARGGTEEAVVSADLDGRQVDRARAAIPNLANRRPEIYDGIGTAGSVGSVGSADGVD